MPKIRLALKPYSMVSDAVESSLGFALNRVEDCCDIEITDENRVELKPLMLNEIMLALEAVIDFERSAVASPKRKSKLKSK
jgi:hypothetical protein